MTKICQTCSNSFERRKTENIARWERRVFCSRMCSDKGTRNKRHGMHLSDEYRIWTGMVSRCHNANAPNYPRYGGIGISVCPAWRDAFEAFYKEVGPRPSKLHTIDRIKSRGNYEPGNVRWATMLEQQCNRRDNRLVDFRGQKMALSEAIRQSGSTVSRSQIVRRLDSGWDLVGAFYTPTNREKSL